MRVAEKLDWKELIAFANEKLFGLVNTIIDETLTYISELLTLTKRDRKQMNIFERKV
jgi:hypothetical protein